ncbi:MAG: carbohydrate ABC transporter permease [Acidobacteria bacterium]|nr:carbohydrate ABC transporter permease [Acidobacteriota bacterium]
MTTVATTRVRRRRWGRGTIFVLMSLMAIVMLYPFWIMVLASFQSNAQYLIGAGHSLASWQQLNSTLPVWQELWNSTVVCTGSIAVIVGAGVMAGFAFSKLTFRGGNILFLAIVSAMMVPLQAIVIPEFVDVARTGITNSYLGAILVYSALGTPFSIFLFTTYFRRMPDELLEAGIVDGLGYWGTLWRLAVPMALPAIATVTVLQFIQIWDDLLVGLLFLQNPSERTITVGLAALAAGHTTSIPLLMAGSIVSALPAMAVYLIFQRFLVRGLTMGIDR